MGGLCCGDCLTEPGIVGLSVVGRAATRIRPARDGQALRGPRRSFGAAQTAQPDSTAQAQPSNLHRTFLLHAALKPYEAREGVSAQHKTASPTPPHSTAINLPRPCSQSVPSNILSTPDMRPSAEPIKANPHKALPEHAVSFERAFYLTQTFH